ncbi:helix-turn-helix transcriptional regulator [Halarchaeum sp. P4]|uniref:helix-turn-helix transcriptional regulator n=1 Tax=Halarchaeum sp. P4 TaxID=3421639 RepID=UPI003EBD1921
MVRSGAVVLAAILLVASVGAAPLAATAGAPSDAERAVGTPAAATDSPSFSSTHFRITVLPNGSATWTFQYRTHLANQTERERFREYARTFERNETQFVRQFRSNARSLVADAENATGREMTATNFERSASTRGLSDDLGVVELSFTWTNFARSQGARLVVGDLFEGGLYLGPNQRLVVTADPALSFASVSPTPNATSDPSLTASDSVTWLGPREFTDEHPRVVLVENTTGTSGVGSETGQTTATTDGTDTSGSSVGPLLGGVLALLAAVGLAVYWQRDRLAPYVADVTPSEATETTDAATAEGEPVDSGDDRAPDAATPVGEPAVTDEEMLADDERVKRLLRDHGGRMRQVSIVEETDWSKSKVSMLLSDMEEDDEISRIRVGRENVVSLPGHEPSTSADEE